MLSLAGVRWSLGATIEKEGEKTTVIFSNLQRQSMHAKFREFRVALTLMSIYFCWLERRLKSWSSAVQTGQTTVYICATNRFARFKDIPFASIFFSGHLLPSPCSCLSISRYNLSPHAADSFLVSFSTMVADMGTTAPVPRFPDDIGTSDFGDFATEDDDDLDNGIDAECSERYDAYDSPRVYYPICVGEVVNQRYSIEHKLGWGGFSTVWMAHDLQTKRDVALKIMTSGSGEENEYRMQREILQSVRDTSHLVTCLDSFLLRGNERNHRVLVMPLRGQPLLSLRGRKMSMSSLMSGARQLLKALENLHRGGIIHRGKQGLIPQQSSHFLSISIHILSQT